MVPFKPSFPFPVLDTVTHVASMAAHKTSPHTFALFFFGLLSSGGNLRFRQAGVEIPAFLKLGKVVSVSILSSVTREH